MPGLWGLRSLSPESNKDTELLHAISGYLVPGREDTLFVWQIAWSKCATTAEPYALPAKDTLIKSFEAA